MSESCSDGPADLGESIPDLSDSVPWDTDYVVESECDEGASNVVPSRPHARAKPPTQIRIDRYVVLRRLPCIRHRAQRSTPKTTGRQTPQSTARWWLGPPCFQALCLTAVLSPFHAGCHGHAVLGCVSRSTTRAGSTWDTEATSSTVIFASSSPSRLVRRYTPLTSCEPVNHKKCNKR